MIDRHERNGKLSIALQTVAAVMLVGLLVSGYLSGTAVWRLIAALLLIILLWATGVLKQRKSRDLDISVMTKQDVLTLLSKYRHEVLNQVQLIKAYIQLGKEERVASALNTLVQAAREQSELGHLWNPIISYAAISAKLDYPGIRIDIRTYIDEQHMKNSGDGDQLLAASEQMPELSDEASRHLASILHELYALAQELQEDTSADINWRLTLIPDGCGIRLNFVLLGEAVTDALIQEIQLWLGQKGLILLYLNEERPAQSTLEYQVEINARLVSLTGKSIWVVQTTTGE